MSDSKLTVSLILNDAGFQKNLKAVNQELKETERDLKNAGNKFDEFGNKVDKNAAASSSLAQKYELLGKKVALYEDEVKKTTTALNELTEKHAKSLATVDSARAKYEQLVDTYGKTSNEVKEYKTELDTIEKQHSALENKILSTDNRLKGLSSSLKSSRNDFYSTAEEIRNFDNNLDKVGSSASNVDKVDDKFDKLHSTIKNVNDTLEKIETNTKLETLMTAVDTLSDVLGDASRAVIDFGKNSVTSFAGFERTVVSGVMKTDNGIQDLQKAMEGLQQLGAEFPVTNDELAVSFDDLAASGYSTEQALEILKGSLNTSTATTEGLEQIVSSTSGAYAVFSDNVADVAELQDVMANAANLGKISFEDLGKQLVKVGGNASSLGMDVRDTSAILAQLTNAGLNADAAGEKLNSMLRQLGAPSKAAKAQLDQLNVSVFDSNGKFRGFTTVMSELNTATANMSEQQKNAAMNTLFGADASSAAVTFMKSGIQATNEYSETLKGATGYVQKLSDAIVANSQSAQMLNDFEGAIDSLRATIGEALQPVLQAILPVVTNILNSFTNASPAVQTLVITLGGIVGVVGTILSILAPLLLSLTSLSTLFSGTAAAAGVATAGISALAAPIGVAIAAVTALYVAYQTNFLGIQEVVSTAFQAIQTIFSSALAVISNVVDVFINLFTGNWTGLWDSVKRLASSAWDFVKTLFSTSANLLVNTIITLGVNLLGSITTAFNYLITGAQNVWASFMQWWNGAVSDPVGTIEGIGSAMYSAGVSIFSSLWDGLKSIWGSIQAWFEEKMNYIKNKVQFWKDKNKEISDSAAASAQMEKAAPASAASISPYTPSLQTFELQSRDISSALEVPNSRSYINDTVVSVGKTSSRQSTQTVSNEAALTLSETQKQNELLMTMVQLLQQDKVTNIEMNVDGKKIARATAKYMNKELYNVNSLNRL